MLAIGAILLIVGIILLIYGFSMFGEGFGNFGMSIQETATTGFASMGYMVAGGFMLVIGVALVYISQFRKVTSYVATEASPAITTASHALGKGLGNGLQESGMASSSHKEIIKVKCPHCGYLESEDAEFCSKCGEKI